MLTSNEIETIKKLLGRDPTQEELLIFDALWSEHASYKSSKIHLKKLPTSSPRVIAGPGENSGIVRLKNGTRIAFKIESHNHPSYIEPYSGAATGVGGIIRDVLCVGARPIALADFLCFGNIKERKTKYLCERVIEGISDYGNSVGIPIVRGQTLFYNYFDHNILVNVMCVGVIPDGIEPVSSKPSKKGVLIYLGGKTGADGIGGASMASAAFDRNIVQKRSAVQIGDPFTEKCLIEAVLEILSSGVEIIAMQDMGAAGFLNSTSEVAAKGDFGVKVDVSAVPKRQPLLPIEVLLSESQERMLLVAERENFNKIKAIAQKWGLECEIVGELQDTKNYDVFENGKKVISIPIEALIKKSPVYDRPQKRPIWIDSLRQVAVEKFPTPKDPSETFLKILTHPLFASKRFVFEQYDSTVLGQTCSFAGADAGIVRISKFRSFNEYEKASDNDIAIAISLDANPLYTFIDPYIGTILCVLEGFRNISCVGAEPVAITNNLNFGNPENEEVMWEFVNSVEGMAKALNELGIPVVSGNVSFYNEFEGVSIPPTPVIGTIGEIYPFNFSPKNYFDPGDFIVLVGEVYPQLAGSLFMYVNFEKVGGILKDPDFSLEKRLGEFIRNVVSQGIVSSAHDVSDGGILPSIFESAVFGIFSPRMSEVGVKLKKVFVKDESKWELYFFSECYPLYVVGVPKKKFEEFVSLCNKNRIPYQVVGEAVEDDIFEVEGFFSFKISELRKLWEEALPKEIL
jgi:phosphoribosylformylglycinamidine synthase II